ncbi:MAG: hypothetical protein LBC83_05260 [Oscillospiraceae bacterium]|jgi:predicted small lipoprotein YifL|nr:hypothetical protein [Oscillospiraceae bacterium]
MKKTVASILALLLVLALAIGFSACGKDEGPTETVPPQTTAPSETDPPSEEDPFAATDPADTVNGSELSTSGTDSTVADPSTRTTVSTAASGGKVTSSVTTASSNTAKPVAKTEQQKWADGDPVDPTKYNKAQLIAYFNAVTQKVRDKKPAFKFERQLKIQDVTSTLLGGIADGIINAVVKDLMPGNWESWDMKKGDANNGKWMSGSEKTATAIKADTIKDITVKKNGSNYVISVTLNEATNPSKTPNSSDYSRLHEIEDPEGIMKSITGSDGTIKGDHTKMILRYNSGYSNVTVNAKSQVVSMDGGFDVDAKTIDKAMGVIGLKGDIKALQTSRVKASGFVW